MYKTVLSLAAALLLSGCGAEKIKDLFKDPDLTEVRGAFKTVFPLSYAADAALKAMAGITMPNVTVVNGTPGATSGPFLVHIAAHDSLPLPSGVAAGGKLIVAGIMTGIGSAMMTVLFTDLTFGAGSFTVQDVSTFPVVRKTDVISGKERTIVVYAAIDVNAGSDTLLTVDMGTDQVNAEMTRFTTMESFDSGVTLEEIAWGITIDDNGTPASLSDDIYSVSGGGQYIEASTGGTAAAALVQMTMIGAELSPSCLKNPRAGWALIQEIGANSGSTSSSVEGGHVFLTFDAKCDGTIKVAAATGSYTPSWGTHVPLNLDR